MEARKRATQIKVPGELTFNCPDVSLQATDLYAFVKAIEDAGGLPSSKTPAHPRTVPMPPRGRLRLSRNAPANSYWIPESLPDEDVEKFKEKFCGFMPIAPLITMETETCEQDDVTVDDKGTIVNGNGEPVPDDRTRRTWEAWDKKRREQRKDW